MIWNMIFSGKQLSLGTEVILLASSWHTLSSYQQANIPAQSPLPQQCRNSGIPKARRFD